MQEINPMHIVHLQRPNVSKEFLNWILKFKFKWLMNILLILFYSAYLLFGAFMLMKFEENQTEDDLALVRKQNLRNDILFFNLYNGYSDNGNNNNNNNFNKMNIKNVNFNQLNRDRQFRLRLDKGLNEFENEISLNLNQAKLKRLTKFNESIYFVIKLLTTLGHDQLNLILIYGSLYTKLFILFYSLIGLSFTFLFVFYYSKLFNYWLANLMIKLNKLKKQKKLSNLKKKKSKSSSLLDVRTNFNSNLDSNLKFVLNNKHHILLPNQCINLNYLNSFSLNELNHPNLDHNFNNSISCDELNNRTMINSFNQNEHLNNYNGINYFDTLSTNSISNINNSRNTFNSVISNNLNSLKIKKTLNYSNAKLDQDNISIGLAFFLNCIHLLIITSFIHYTGKTRSFVSFLL